MNTYKKAAVVAGVLFIIATAASLISLPFLNPIKTSNYLVSVSTNGSQVSIGALFSLIAAFASASIAISLYPVLRKYREALALAAVGFRLIEGVFYIAAVMLLLTLISLSQEFVKAGAPDSSYYQAMGTSLLAGYNWAGNVGSVLAFCFGALTYYYIFYQTKLVPRWLSGWGLVAIVMLAVAIILVLFRVIGPMSTLQVILALPIAVQEMVLAVWLIVKGFDPSAITSLSARTESSGIK